MRLDPHKINSSIAKLDSTSDKCLVLEMGTKENIYKMTIYLFISIHLFLNRMPVTSGMVMAACLPAVSAGSPSASAPLGYSL